jgi:hypothetical protein
MNEIHFKQRLHVATCIFLMIICSTNLSCFKVARRFAQVLRRQTSLNHLCQASRTVVHSAEITSQMLDDWLSVDRNSIVKQTLYTMDNYCENDHQMIIQCKYSKTGISGTRKSSLCG